MRHLTKNITDILPTQHYVYKHSVLEYANQINQQGYHPAPTLETTTGFLLGDGHHTASALYLLGEKEIEIIVLETAKEILNSQKGLFAFFPPHSAHPQHAIKFINRQRQYLATIQIHQIPDLFLSPAYTPSSQRVRDLILQPLLNI